VQDLIYGTTIVLVVCGSALVGIALIVAWDWFFWRRLPHVRWLATRLNAQEFSLMREILRVRRLKEQSPAITLGEFIASDEVRGPEIKAGMTIGQPDETSRPGA